MWLNFVVIVSIIVCLAAGDGAGVGKGRTVEYYGIIYQNFHGGKQKHEVQNSYVCPIL